MPSNHDLTKLVDTLGHIRARIAELQNQETRLRSRLIASGQNTIEGQLFRATVIHANVHRVDYVGLIARARLPKRLIQQYTTTSDVIQVRLTAR